MDKNKIRLALYSYKLGIGLYDVIYFTVNDRGYNTDKSSVNYKVKEFETKESIQSLINNKIFVQHFNNYSQVTKVITEEEYQWIMIK